MTQTLIIRLSYRGGQLKPSVAQSAEIAAHIDPWFNRALSDWRARGLRNKGVGAYRGATGGRVQQ
jgi:hypothetical protein